MRYYSWATSPFPSVGRKLAGRPFRQRSKAAIGAAARRSRARRPLSMNIRMGSIEEPAVQALLSGHRQDMHAYSPPDSVHALSASELAAPSVTLWCAWDGNELLGCGALKALDDSHGEIKSMRTSEAHRRRGVAEALLRRIIDEARSRGYRKLSLETGSHQAFRPARKLYEKYGFEFCGPFEPYGADPYSVFMSREI